MQGIFIEVGMGSMDTYDADFEAYLLAESAAYYQRKAAAWIQVLLPSAPAGTLLLGQNGVFLKSDKTACKGTRVQDTCMRVQTWRTGGLLLGLHAGRDAVQPPAYRNGARRRTPARTTC